ncbi:hypothetical protein [Crossiella sp. CA198]|uniref:hypothetical protein n=1 Tax=Crossiella sp. CA198 TaxID=3455607 RepID=UPI003F8D3234
MSKTQHTLTDEGESDMQDFDREALAGLRRIAEVYLAIVKTMQDPDYQADDPLHDAIGDVGLGELRDLLLRTEGALDRKDLAGEQRWPLPTWRGVWAGRFDEVLKCPNCARGHQLYEQCRWP